MAEKEEGVIVGNIETVVSDEGRVFAFRVKQRNSHDLHGFRNGAGIPIQYLGLNQEVMLHQNPDREKQYALLIAGEVQRSYVVQRVNFNSRPDTPDEIRLV